MEKDQKASKFPQIMAAMAACVGAFGLGTGLGWTSPALPQITDTCKSDGNSGNGTCYFDTPLDQTQGSLIGGLFNIGALVSGIITGYLMSKIGRKWTMIMMAVPFTLGWVFLLLPAILDASEAWLFYLGRILTGFGGGAFALLAPIYISETAETSIRGALGSCMQLLLTVGVLYVNALNTSTLEWDVITWLCLPFPILLAILMFFMPESPYFLVTRGKEKEAKKALKFLRGSHYDVDGELRELTNTFAKQQEIGSITIKEFFTTGIYIKPGLIMLVLMFFQQYSGINSVLFYLNDIFINSGTGIEPEIGATIVTVVQVLSTVVAVLIVDKFGRKILLFLSGLIMCGSIFGLGVYFYYDFYTECPSNSVNVTDSMTTAVMTTPYSCNPIDGKFDKDIKDNLNWLPLTSLIVYIFAFSIGFGPLPWMMNGEFFSLESKDFASSLVTAFNWFCSFLVTTLENPLEHGFGNEDKEVYDEGGIHIFGAYFLYGCCCALGCIFVIFFVPETKGKSPEDMKNYFRKK